MEEPSREEKELVLELLLGKGFCFNQFLTRSERYRKITKNQFLMTLYWLEAKKYVYRLPGNVHEYSVTKRGQTWHVTYLKEYKEEVLPSKALLLRMKKKKMQRLD